tara:strand:- start:414 stop:1274 length:861 start_codon:yes stop_codon:yes gene_type:complete
MNKFVGLLSARKGEGPFNQMIRSISNSGKFNTYWNTNLNIKELDDKNIILCDMMVQSPTHNMIKYRREKKLDYYHIDHAYFWRGYAYMTGNKNPHNCSWFRISKNSHVLNKILDVDDSRWKKYFYDHFGGYGKEYSKRGSKIIFCPSSHHVLSLYDQNNWIDETINTLKKYTDREIVIRRRPNLKTEISNVSTSTGNTLEKDLEDCWALVTHSSGAATEAQLLGIPTFSDINSPSAPVSSLDYSSIEKPFYPDDNLRMKWLNSLAYSQYSDKEFKDGTLVNNIKLF